MTTPNLQTVAARLQRNHFKNVECGSRHGKSALAVVAIQSYCLDMLDWSKCAAVERIAGKVSGAWLFKGTRVPVAALFENLEDGATVDDFLEWFPGVNREQVEAVLEHARQSLAAA